MQFLYLLLFLILPFLVLLVPVVLLVFDVLLVPLVLLVISSVSSFSYTAFVIVMDGSYWFEFSVEM